MVFACTLYDTDIVAIYVRCMFFWLSAESAQLMFYVIDRARNICRQFKNHRSLPLRSWLRCILGFPVLDLPQVMKPSQGCRCCPACNGPPYEKDTKLWAFLLLSEHSKHFSHLYLILYKS